MDDPVEELLSRTFAEPEVDIAAAVMKRIRISERKRQRFRVLLLGSAGLVALGVATGPMLTLLEAAPTLLTDFASTQPYFGYLLLVLVTPWAIGLLSD